jgi:oligoendopeptidase F
MTSNTNWDLKPLGFSSEDNLINDVREVIAKITTLNTNWTNKYVGKVSLLTTKEWLEFIQEMESIEDEMSKTGIMTGLFATLKTQDNRALSADREMSEALKKWSLESQPITDEIMLLGYEKLVSLSNQPGLSRYKEWFVALSINVERYLGSQVETALITKSPVLSSGWYNLYEEMHGSLKYKLEGDDRIYTESDVRSMRMSPISEVRAKAADSLARENSSDSFRITAAHTYLAIVKDWTTTCDLRKYTDVMSPRNENEQLRDNFVNALLDIVHQAYPVYHKFLAIKNKILGTTKLSPADLYAPFTQIEDTITWDNAWKQYIEVANKFDPEMAKFGEDMYTNNRIDVYPNIGKRGGAFASYHNRWDSWVLLNHTDNISSLFTLAHEMGHAYHGHLSRYQSSLCYHPGLAFAETASTFNELLVGAKLMQEVDNQTKISLLAQKLDDHFATIWRQVMYTRFERIIHNKIRQGEVLQKDDLDSEWAKGVEELCGDTLDKNKRLYQHNWAGISHIFDRPYYCYAYAFGDLFSLSLFSIHSEDPVNFLPKYRKFLSAGGSLNPKELVAIFDLDLDNPTFLNKGIAYITSLVEELQILTKH